MDLKEQTKAPAETETRTGSYVGNPGSKAGAAPVERAPRPIEDGVDIGHGTHEAIYLRDPEENGIELCWDRPEKEWDRDANGHYALGNRRLDLAGLLRAGLDESS